MAACCKTTLNAISAARTIAQGTGGAFDVLAIGQGAAKAAGEVGAFGARKVFATEIAGGYTAEGYAATVAQLGKGYGVVLATASTYGKDLLPRVAAKLSAGLASDISKVNVEGGKLSYKRPTYAGNVYATMEVNTPIQVVSVRQSEFEQAAASGGSSPVENYAVVADPAAGKVQFVSIESVKSARPDLAGGGHRGLWRSRTQELRELQDRARALVDAFGAAMGASRAACDAGYVPNDLQVGQTGKVVAPKLYVAVGISGAIQHLAGMKGSKVIVAVNKDKEAPIAQVADYFLVADLFKAVPELTDAVEEGPRSALISQHVSG